VNKVRLGLHYSLLSLLIISTVGQSTICTSSSLSTDTDGVGNGFPFLSAEKDDGSSLFSSKPPVSVESDDGVQILVVESEKAPSTAIQISSDSSEDNLSDLSCRPSTDTDGVGNGFEENIRESGSFSTELAVSNGVDVNKGGLGLHSSLLSILILLVGENPVTKSN
jgi:hypothetical protein